MKGVLEDHFVVTC